MVVVENPTNTTHFILIKMQHKETNIVDIYMKEITRQHGVPKGIISNKDP
jgi:hypothetical protein